MAAASSPRHGRSPLGDVAGFVDLDRTAELLSVLLIQRREDWSPVVI
jgi:hypothetical protein